MLYTCNKYSELLIIKCGGSILSNNDELNNLIQGILVLKELGYKIIIVHGGGDDINHLCSLFKIEQSFSHGLRVTTSQVMDITKLALLGKTNVNLIHKFSQAQIKAIGLSGHDNNLLIADFIDKDTLGYVGEIKSVNSKFIYSLLELNITPVIAPLAIDNNGNTFNINADLAAASIALEICADKLIILSDIDGYYTDYANKNSLVNLLTACEIKQLLDNPDIDLLGMHPKLSACAHAVSNGIKSAHIINGKNKNNLLQLIQTTHAIGTTIISGEE